MYPTARSHSPSLPANISSSVSSLHVLILSLTSNMNNWPFGGLLNNKPLSRLPAHQHRLNNREVEDQADHVSKASILLCFWRVLTLQGPREERDPHSHPQVKHSPERNAFIEIMPCKSPIILIATKRTDPSRWKETAVWVVFQDSRTAEQASIRNPIPACKTLQENHKATLDADWCNTWIRNTLMKHNFQRGKGSSWWACWKSDKSVTQGFHFSIRLWETFIETTQLSPLAIHRQALPRPLTLSWERPRNHPAFLLGEESRGSKKGG